MNIDKYQQYLFSEQFSLDRMSVLQRNSRVRLQVIEMNNQTYIRSIKDKYKSIRVLVLALMVHIYERKDRERINRLKQIVYQSELQHLTASQGLLREQLQRNVGYHLSQASQGQDIEFQLIKCFNCVAFFDEVIISSFRQHFLLPKFESFETWQRVIRTQFGIPIIITDKNRLNISNKSDGVQLINDSDILYLPSIHNRSVEVDSVIGSGSFVDEIEVTQRKDLMLISIDSCQSPLINKEHMASSNTLKKSHKIQAFEEKLALPRSRDQQRSTFWSIFCCGD